MADMFFVKKGNIVYYHGNDGKIAENTVCDMSGDATLSVYNLSPDIISVVHRPYKDGKQRGFTWINMPRTDPLVDLVLRELHTPGWGASFQDAIIKIKKDFHPAERRYIESVANRRAA